MTDVVLRTGQSNPNDVVLYDPTVVPVRGTKVGSFVAITSGGPTQAVTGVGFQPKALIVWQTNNTADGFTSGHSFSIGITDGTNSRCISAAGDDNVSTTNEGRSFETELITILTDGTPTLGGRATISSFDANGFTINWTTLPGTAVKLHYLAIAGDSITSVKVGDFALNTVVGNQSVHNTGGTGDFVLFLTDGLTTMTTNSSFAKIGVGAAVSSTARWTRINAGTDGVTMAAIADYNHVFDSAKCIRSQSGAGQIDYDADFVSFDSPDGFTINITNQANATASLVAYLLIKGGSWDVQNWTKSTGSAPATDNQTVLSYVPDALFFGMGQNVSSGTGTGNYFANYGAFDGSTQKATGSEAATQTIPTTNDRDMKDGDSILLWTLAASPSSLDVEGQAGPMRANGFNFTWNPNTANAWLMGYFACNTGGISATASGSIGPPLNTLSMMGVGM